VSDILSGYNCRFCGVAWKLYEKPPYSCPHVGPSPSKCARSINHQDCKNGPDDDGVSWFYNTPDGACACGCHTPPVSDDTWETLRLSLRRLASV